MTNLVCKIELNKNKGHGVTVTVFNKDDNITQTCTLNGTTIITTCEGQSSKSEIKQTEDSIFLTSEKGSVTVKCKDFVIDAETINCKSSKETAHQSSTTYEVTSTQDMTLKTNTTLSATAASIEASSQKAAVEAQSLSMSGTQTKLEGKLTADIEGLAIKVKGPRIDIGG
ncbi:hypothetical protein [Candidatus Uabimicrobium amorphum]|uniref:Uncharacterized protein n=1 Tax=Uabimicrobium amorphum TaxID=2596890 RepID=A0A5S9IS18_UABAM|nr:hypothetical protein [Candidatus Uabimicrobium amorphum]BBM86667.1 hypothetical protein UABAM_05053 [Candidatus Uabimicrobium amorphum]